MRGKTVSQGHTARLWGSQDSNPGSVGQSHVPERGLWSSQETQTQPAKGKG